MRTQQRFFAQPFRKVYRRRRTPRLDRMRQKKKRKARQARRRQETKRRLDGGRAKPAIRWSPEQLARIRKRTAG